MSPDVVMPPLEGANATVPPNSTKLPQLSMFARVIFFAVKKVQSLLRFMPFAPVEEDGSTVAESVMYTKGTSNSGTAEDAVI